MDIKDKFLNQANGFEMIFNDVFSSKNQAGDEDSEIALLLFNQADSAEKSDVTANIDNMEKVYNVIQLQTEMMTEYIRATVGSIMSWIASEEAAEDEIIPMFMFVHEKMIKLHDQLDFFYSSFEEEDLKKGFSITRRSVAAMKFTKNTEKDQVIAFVRSLKSRVLGYLTTVNNMHDWLHGMLDTLDSELNKNGEIESVHHH
ncbi:hypothetical protein [Lactococcus allomyrinae]|uniref:Uncharacterized protein n=1 Tax=Lactococcus allomyrinae TaxID=2419773 RepID=A0A387BC27_9LACT|nr:hypothetical protein [Lactococcus allomyrinae]AYF99997.1 hypothetical protein D7I46_02175 [Lactococcus allomyrinae]